jgi:hypothetical protein
MKEGLLPPKSWLAVLSKYVSTLTESNKSGDGEVDVEQQPDRRPIVGSSESTWYIISLHVLYMYTNNRAHANSNKTDVNKTCNRLDATLSSTRIILQQCTFVLEWQRRLFKQQPKHNHRQAHLVCDALKKSYWLRQELPQGSASEPSAEPSEVSVSDVHQHCLHHKRSYHTTAGRVSAKTAASSRAQDSQSSPSDMLTESTGEQWHTGISPLNERLLCLLK